MAETVNVNFKLDKEVRVLLSAFLQKKLAEKEKSLLKSLPILRLLALKISKIAKKSFKTGEHKNEQYR